MPIVSPICSSASGAPSSGMSSFGRVSMMIGQCQR